MKESDHYENEMYFVKSDCFSTYVDMYRGGYTSFAQEMNSDEFFKTADLQKEIKVQEDTTVTPSHDPDGTVTEPDVKKYMVEGYTIKVDR